MSWGVDGCCAESLGAGAKQGAVGILVLDGDRSDDGCAAPGCVLKAKGKLPDSHGVGLLCKSQTGSALTMQMIPLHQSLSIKEHKLSAG